MPLLNPTQLVDEYKKSGEFDRLRRELLSQFRSSEGMAPFMSRVEDIVKRKLSSDSKLQYMPETNVVRELMQELDRYPIVERAVTETPAFADPAFAASIRQQVTSILQDDRNPRPNGTPSGPQINQNNVPHTAGSSASTVNTSHPHPGIPRPDSTQVSGLSPLLNGRSNISTEKASDPAVNLRAVNFINTSVANTNGGEEEPASPGSAMIESPLTEDNGLEPREQR